MGTAFKVIKIVVSVASVGLSIASGIIANKELDNKIAEKVAEAVAKQVKEEL